MFFACFTEITNFEEAFAVLPSHLRPQGLRRQLHPSQLALVEGGRHVKQLQHAFFLPVNHTLLTPTHPLRTLSRPGIQFSCCPT